MRIGEHHHAPLAIFAQDLVGAVGFAHLGDLAHGHPAVWCFQQQITQSCCGALRVIEAHHHIETTRAIEQTRDDAAVGETLQLFGDSLRLQAVERSPGEIDDDLQLRHAHLFFHLQVGHPFYLGDPAPGVFGQSPDDIEVLAEELDDDLRTHTRKHVIQPMRYRLSDIQSDRQHGQPRPQIGDDFFFLAPAGREIDFEFGRVHALGMFIEFRPTRAPSHGLHLGYAQYQLLGDQPDAVGFGERDTGSEEHVDRKGAFIERGQERARQHPGRRCREQDGGHRESDQPLLVGKGAL